MAKYIIDTGKLSSKKKKIFRYLINYDLIIFDLDDTIFPLFYYDRFIFKKISKKISKKTELNTSTLYDFLIYNKFNKKKKIKLFNLFIKKFKLMKIISEKKLVSYHQNYPKINNFNPPSLIDLIKKLKKKRKKLMLITEGNKQRQENKIKSLGIEKLFDYKIILDGKHNRKFKPSSKGVHKYLNTLEMNKSIYLGDSLKDRKLSKSIGVKFYYFDITNYIKISKLCF